MCLVLVLGLKWNKLKFSIKSQHLGLSKNISGSVQKQKMETLDQNRLEFSQKLAKIKPEIKPEIS